MQWFFIALGAPFLWAVVNIADNYLVARYSKKEKERSSGALVLFASFTGLIFSMIIWFFIPSVFHVPFWDKLLLLIAGALAVIWILMYLFALEIEETSAIVPWFLIVPIVGYILGYFFLGETLTYKQFLGSIIIMLGLIFISMDFGPEKKKFNHKPVLYMICAAVSIAVSGIIFKYVTVEGNFWISSFWEYAGLGVTGLLIYTLIPHYRHSFHEMSKEGGATIILLNTLTELMSIAGNLLTSFALLLAPVAMVYLVGSFQPAIVLLLAVFGTKFFPHIVKEDISRENLAKKVLALIVVLIGTAILFI